MFKSVLLTPVLILSLVLCPLYCTGVLADAEIASVIAEGGCGCCVERAGAGAESSNLPANPNKSWACGNCLCHGAVAADRADTIVSLDLEPWAGLGFLSENTASLVLLLRRDLSTELTEPLSPHGYSIRILHQSLLL